MKLGTSELFTDQAHQVKKPADPSFYDIRETRKARKDAMPHERG
jgi:hypothetical protein